MGRKKTDPEQRKRKRLLVPTILLLLIGLGASLYLGNLHLKVHGPGGHQVQSFCAISKGFNCITVATSEYSSFLGIPVALFGVEFFVAGLAVVLLSAAGGWRVRAWDSLLFIGMVLSLPACGVLAWISISCIESVCIICTLIYGVNLVLFALLLLANRRRLGKLLTEGPRELLKNLATARGGIGVTLVASLAISQFFWVPRLLHADAKPPETKVAEAWHGLPTAGLTLGPKDAPITVEEFTDFECPYCSKAHHVMVRAVNAFRGKVYLVHRDFPLDMACHPMIQQRFHGFACQAAYYARCAGKQDKYWPYEAKLFENQQRLAAADLKGYAREIGLDLDRLAKCVESPATRAAVIEDIRLGLKRAMKGTPTFFVNGEMIVGLRPFEFWQSKFNALLQQAEKNRP